MSHNHKSHTTILILCGLFVFVLACTGGLFNTRAQMQATLDAVDATSYAMATWFVVPSTLTPTLDATANAVVRGVEHRQWASGATATSENDGPEWSSVEFTYEFKAMQATGAPTTSDCGSTPMAWASEPEVEVATLTLTYDVPVVPSSIEIHQSFFPGAVVKVEVVDEAGTPSIVYQGQAAAIDQCPYVQIIPVTGVTAKVTTVNITVAQTYITRDLTLNQPIYAIFTEIDAVELIGIP